MGAVGGGYAQGRIDGHRSLALPHRSVTLLRSRQACTTPAPARTMNSMNRRMVARVIRHVASLLVGLASLFALVLVGALLATTVSSPVLAGYEVMRALGVVVLVATLALVVVAWARFVVAIRRSNTPA